MMGERLEYLVVHPDGSSVAGTITHHVDRAPAMWALDDLRGLIIRLRNYASGGELHAGDEIVCELSATSGVGTLIVVGVRGTTASVQLTEHLDADLVHRWHQLQPGAMWTTPSDRSEGQN